MPATTSREHQQRRTTYRRASAAPSDRGAVGAAAPGCRRRRRTSADAVARSLPGDVDRDGSGGRLPAQCVRHGGASPASGRREVAGRPSATRGDTLAASGAPTTSRRAAAIARSAPPGRSPAVASDRSTTSSPSCRSRHEPPPALARLRRTPRAPSESTSSRRSPDRRGSSPRRSRRSRPSGSVSPAERRDRSTARRRPARSRGGTARAVAAAPRHRPGLAARRAAARRQRRSRRPWPPRPRRGPDAEPLASSDHDSSAGRSLVVVGGRRRPRPAAACPRSRPATAAGSTRSPAQIARTVSRNRTCAGRGGQPGQHHGRCRVRRQRRPGRIRRARRGPSRGAVAIDDRPAVPPLPGIGGRVADRLGRPAAAGRRADRRRACGRNVSAGTVTPGLGQPVEEHAAGFRSAAASPR